MNGWFADPKVTDRFVLGDCRCPGKPHDEDFMVLRSELSGTDLAEMENASGADRLKLLLVEWNLRDESGALEMTSELLGRLYLDVFGRLNTWLDKHATVAALPNVSSAPSRNGSRESASQTRTTRQRR
jgi:hypothetical protein